MPRWFPAIAVAAVAIALAVAAGCGGSSRESHASLVADANAICQRLNHQLSVGELTKLRGAKLHAAVRDAFDAAVGELKALRPSKADAATFGRFVDDTERQRAQIVASESAYSPASVAANQKLYVEIATASQVALRLGIAQCALQADTTQPSASAGDYHAFLEGSCGQFLVSVLAIPKPTSPAELVTWIDRVNPLYAQFLRDAKAARPPRAGAAPIDDWISADARLKAALDALARDAANRQTTRVSADLLAARAASRAISADASADGIPACADVGQHP